MATITDTKSRLAGALTGLKSQVGFLERKEERDKQLADLKRSEQAEQNALMSLTQTLAPVLTELQSLNWPTLARAVNIGNAESEVKSILGDLKEAIAFHNTILALLEGGTDPSDEHLAKVSAASGLAERLGPRIEALAASLEALGGIK